jgi:hypothetical protein
VEDLIQNNNEYHVEECAPGLFLFGSSGGGEAFAFDARSTPPRDRRRSIYCHESGGRHCNSVELHSVPAAFVSIRRSLLARGADNCNESGARKVKMTFVSLENLFANFKANPPASRDAVARCEASLGFSLPPDYTQALRQMNGGEGFIGKNYLVLWSVEEFVKMNTGTYFAEAAPGLLVFGSDGGGEAFAFDTRSAPPPIVVAPFIGMDWTTAIMIAPTFTAFLQHLYRSEDLF